MSKRDCFTDSVKVSIPLPQQQIMIEAVYSDLSVCGIEIQRD